MPAARLEASGAIALANTTRRWLLAICLLLSVAVMGVVTVVSPWLDTAAAPDGWMTFEDCAYARNCADVVHSWSPAQRQIAAALMGLNCLFLVAYTALLFLGLRMSAPLLPGWLAWPSQVLAWLVLPVSSGDLMHKLILFPVLSEPGLASARETTASLWATLNLGIVLPAVALLLVDVLVICMRRAGAKPNSSSRSVQTLMKAVSVASKGQLQVIDAPTPVPGKGEVLVEVSHSAVNGMDVEVSEGGWASYAKKWRQFGPTLTGIEFSGVARSAGRRIRAGQRVIGYSHVLKGPRTHQQFVAMPERDLQVIPASVTNEAAAALVVGGLTSIAILEGIRRLRPGERCLVIGAAGGVGCYAVQLAHAAGARVTATGAEADAQWLRSLGADEVRSGRGASLWKSGDRFDLVIDTPAVFGFGLVAPHLSPRGTYVSTHPEKDLGGIVRSWFSGRRAGWLMVLRSNEQALARLMALAEQGVLKPVVDSVHPLREAGAAFSRVAGSGKRGRVLLKLM